MANNRYYIVFKRESANATISIDGYQVAASGTRDEMAKIYREAFGKAKFLVNSGDAKNLKERYDKDGTFYFRVERGGDVMHTYLCDYKVAKGLLCELWVQ